MVFNGLQRRFLATFCGYVKQGKGKGMSLLFTVYGLQFIGVTVRLKS